MYKMNSPALKPKEIKADIVGISAITPAVNKAYELARIFKERNIPVFMGGTHATLYPEEVELHCDSVLCGLADDIVPELINDFLKTGKLKKRYTQKSDMSLKNMALPQRDIYERKSIWADELNMVQATFGCSNTCKFCVQPYQTIPYLSLNTIPLMKPHSANQNLDTSFPDRRDLLSDPDSR